MNKIQEINEKRNSIRNQIDGFEKAIPIYPTLQVNLHDMDKLDLNITEHEEVSLRLYIEGEKRTVPITLSKENSIAVSKWIIENLEDGAGGKE